MAVSLEQSLVILAYAYPAVVSAFFVASSLVAVCKFHKQSEEEKACGTRIRRVWLLALFAILTLSYLVEALTLVINGIVSGSWPRDDIVVGRSFCVLAFTVQLAQLFDNAHPVWYPFRGTWMLGLVGESLMEVIIMLLTHSLRAPFPRTIQLALGAVRIVLLLLLLIGSTQPPARFSDQARDEEHQRLIPDSTVSKGNSNTGYGSNSAGDSTSSGSDSDTQTSPGIIRAERRNQRFRDRLMESGSWLQYARSYTVLLPYLWPARNLTMQLRAVGVLCCLLASNALHILVPRQTAIIIDSLSGQGRADPWTAVAVFVVLQVLASELGVSLLQEWLVKPLQFYSQEQMLRAVYAHLMHLSADFHDSKSSSDAMVVLWGGGSSISDILENVLLHGAPRVLDLMIAVVYLSKVFGPYEGLITISTGVAYLLLTSRLIESSRKTTTMRRNAIYLQQSLAATGIFGWHTVAAFNQIDYEINRHSDAVVSRYHLEKKSEMDWQISVGIQSAALTFGFIASAMLAVSEIRSGHVSSGQFAMLLAYWSQLTTPLQFITRLGKNLSDSFINAEEVLTIMRTQPSVKTKASARPLKFAKGDVLFDKVKFSYDGKKQIINEICLSVPAGQTVAFVGATGAGKSTMLKLLNRFYDVTGGSISIDGQDLRDVDLHSLRDRIGVVPQDPLLFDDTIINNVRYSRITASDEEVFAACRAACIHDKIMDMAQGYQTEVGDRGLKLSGGELQRVAIARAILKQPDIVLLDEATSAVDTETEYNIQQSLKRLCKGRTTFVVAHRLSTIMNADRIVVVDKGQVLEEGDHDDLLSRNGKYASLWARQAFLKPKETSKGPNSEESLPVVNDLPSAQNAAEMSKVNTHASQQQASEGDGADEAGGS